MKCLFGFLFLFATSSIAQSRIFTILPLGVKGGGDEGNLSCYMVAAVGTNNYVCLDAGTLNAGLQKAIRNHIIKGSPEEFIRNNIKGYLISHGHLDHLSGLILNSPDDGPKNIYVLPFVKEVLKEKYFTPQGWTNFANEGETPLNKYHYVTLEVAKESPLTGTNLFVTAFPLSHGSPYKSSAFLIRSGINYLLYLGDTGADAMEQSNNLELLWAYVAPLVQAKKLKAIFIECSFQNEQPNNKLFGHLTPKLLLNELHNLTEVAGEKNMREVSIVITHIKPGGSHETLIKKQLSEGKGKMKFIYPVQGNRVDF